MKEWYEALKESSESWAKTLFHLATNSTADSASASASAPSTRNNSVTESIDQIFAPDECFDLSELDWLTNATTTSSNNGFTMTNTNPTDIDLCINLPTEFSDQCGFKEESLLADGSASNLSRCWLMFVGILLLFLSS